jgi:tRNA(ile)-lysidine synthetase
MKKIIVAVSGGVDSIVLLDFLSIFFEKKNGKDWVRKNLIIAHFEHGIRGKESEDDLEFVRELAKKYDLRFEFECGNLGKNSSEEKARKARYAFLKHLSKIENAEIFTAHHLNDLVETVLINLHRGTGWRGLACLNSKGVKRPLLHLKKEDILKYAKKHNLVWQEDSTNFSNKYLRNRFRKKIENKNIYFKEIYQLWKRQIELKQKIDFEISKILPEVSFEEGGKLKFKRSFFIQIDENIACEILQKICLENCGKTLIWAQIQDFWVKIKTIQSGKKAEIGGGIRIGFSKDCFWFENSPKK